jgi:Na+/phosphate symporter
MEEREIMQKFSNLFSDTVTVMEGAGKGFITLNSKRVKEELEKFRVLLKSRLPDVEKVIAEKEKGEVEKKFIGMIIPFQTVALSIENLLEKMELKLDSNVLFSEKATKELKELYLILEGQIRDTADYVVTKNPHLKDLIRKGMEDMKKLIDEYAVVHQNRLITGVCMPKASYLYIDITDSLKRAARGLVEFAEKV